MNSDHQMITKLLSRIVLAVALNTGSLMQIKAANAQSEVLLEEDFSGSTIPRGWVGNRKAFSIVAGTLRGVAAPGDSHGPALILPITGHDLTVEFDVKFAKPGYFLFLIDGDSQFRGQAHLLRFSIGGTQYQLAQDRGDPASKLAQKKERDRRGGKRIPATKEQLADPSFYRIDRLAFGKTKAAVDEWRHVRIELRGNKVKARLGDDGGLTAIGTVLDVKKSKIVFLVAQTADVRIDNLKVVALENRGR